MKRSHVRFALLATISAVAAYSFASMFSWINAAVAGLTAFIAIRSTFHETVAESIRQVIGTLLGALLGYLLVIWIGSSPVVMLILLLFSFVLSRILRLGEEGAVVMGVTVILVLGPLTNVTLIETRFAAVVLGVLVALVASLWVRPGLPHNRAAAAATDIEAELAEILRTIAQHLSDGKGHVDIKVARSALTDTARMLRDLEVIRNEADAAVTASRWSPMLDREAALDALHQVKMAQTTAETVLNMARTLEAAAVHDEQLPTTMVQNLAQVISATADIVDDTMPTTTAIQVIEQGRGAVVDSIKQLDDTQILLVGSGLLQDTENLKRKRTQRRRGSKA